MVIIIIINCYDGNTGMIKSVTFLIIVLLLSYAFFYSIHVYSSEYGDKSSFVKGCCKCQNQSQKPLVEIENYKPKRKALNS